MSIASYVLKRQKLAKRFSRFVSFEEMIGFLVKGVTFEKTELLRRTHGYVFSQAGLVSGEGVEVSKRRSKRRIAVEASSLNDRLRGRRAYPGKVTGRVKIVLSQRDFSSFKSGEVLVTPMTTPEYLPLLRRAAAVVTDEGGVTCHAAILCREYRKPCIVGTGRATQAFETGDIVTVDATKEVMWRCPP